jgi:hypothetical protein
MYVLLRGDIMRPPSISLFLFRVVRRWQSTTRHRLELYVATLCVLYLPHLFF